MTAVIQTKTRTQTSTAFYPSLALFIFVFCAAIWGSGTVLSKYTLNYFPPMTLLTVELLASCMTLWGILFISGGHKRFRLRDWRYGAGGLLEPGLAYVLMTAGLAQTSATNSSLILSLEALITGLMAWVFLREKLPCSFWMFSSIALIGVVVLSVAGATEGDSASLSGDILMLAGTICASLYVVVSRHSIGKISPILLAAMQHTVGLVVMLGIAIVQGELLLLEMPPLSAWLLAGFSGTMQYAIAFVLYLAALRYISAGKAAMFFLLIPVFGVVSAMIFLGETLTFAQAVGGALIIAALLPVQLMGAKNPD